MRQWVVEEKTKIFGSPLQSETDQRSSRETRVINAIKIRRYFRKRGSLSTV